MDRKRRILEDYKNNERCKKFKNDEYNVKENNNSYVENFDNYEENNYGYEGSSFSENTFIPANNIRDNRYKPQPHQNFYPHQPNNFYTHSDPKNDHTNEILVKIYQTIRILSENVFEEIDKVKKLIRNPKKKVDVNSLINRDEFFKRLYQKIKWTGIKDIHIKDIIFDRYGNEGRAEVKNYDPIAILLDKGKFINKNPKQEFLGYDELVGNLYYDGQRHKLTTEKMGVFCVHHMSSYSCRYGNKCEKVHMEKEKFKKLLLKYIIDDYHLWLKENNLSNPE